MKCLRTHPLSFCHNHNVHNNILWQSNWSPKKEEVTIITTSVVNSKPIETVKTAYGRQVKPVLLPIKTENDEKACFYNNYSITIIYLFRWTKTHF